jgi:hypothetical protein
MTDMPNVREYYFGTPARLLRYQGQYFACVVCLKGLEGMDLPRKIVAYGCFEFFHEITWNPTTETYDYARFLAGQWANGQGTQIVADGYAGRPPPLIEWDEELLQ